jgi:hypothetical protein
MRSAAKVSQQMSRLDVRSAMKQVPQELKQFLEKIDVAK